MTVLRVLRTAKAALSRTFYLDEVGMDATGSVGVVVSRLDGTVVDTANATGPVNHAYTYDFPGRDVIDELIVTWTATLGGDAVTLDEDRLEIVGGFYFGLAEGRAVDSAISNLTKYPTADLIEHRIEVEAECERITGQAWVPRFARAVLSGSGRSTLQLPHTMIRAIRAITVGTTAYGVDQVAAAGFTDAGVLTHSHRGAWNGTPWIIGARNVVVEYEHGHDRPNAEIVRGSKIRFKSLVLSAKSALPDRAERLVTVEAGTVLLATASANRTGIPEVDAIYDRYPSPRPGFG